METSKTSDLLQSRLRERKAEAARASKSRPHRSSNAHAPDDAIFDDAEPPESPKANMSKHYHTPSADSGRRQSNKPGSRRGSNMGASKDHTPRAMGVREMEEYVDKLSKQNFDLKLEVYHRREKIDELEKKLEEAAAFEEENADLLQINDELLKELEKRDVAVDEAVVMICDLEEKLRQLEDQNSSKRPPAAWPSKTESEDKNTSANRRESQPRTKVTPPRKSKDSSRIQVSPEVSARMATLAKPGKTVTAIHPPAFLQDNGPSTLALRGLFVDGDKPIRPIPSYASLLSRQSALEEDELHIDVLKSPRLSVLSESDLKSIYGPDHDDIYPKSPKKKDAMSEHTQKGTNHDEASRQRKLARVNRWVEDRALSPAAQTRLKRAPKALNSDQFQSLGDVLHQDQVPLKTETRAKTSSANHETLTVAQTTKPRRTPPMTVHPVFGQTYFPPTPDTMITHTLNHSSSSIVPDKNNSESLAVPSRNFGSQIPTVQEPTLASPLARPGVVARHSILPQEVESFGDADLSDEAQQYSTNGYGSFQTGGSDESTSTGSPQYTAQSPTRSSPSPEQLFKSRRRPAPIVSSGAISRPSVLRISTEPRPYTDPLASPTSPYTPPKTAFPSFHQADLRTSLADSTSLLPTTPPKATKKSNTDHHIPHYQSHSQPQQTYPTNSSHQFPTSPTAVYSTPPTAAAPAKSPPSAFLQQSTSLRSRVARLTRRNSNSTPSVASGQARVSVGSNASPHSNTYSNSGALSGPEDRPARKRSIKQRFFQRRSSSAHEPVISRPDQDSPQSPTNRRSVDTHIYSSHSLGANTRPEQQQQQQQYPQKRAQIAAPNAYQPLQHSFISNTSTPSGHGSARTARFFSPNSSADESGPAYAVASPGLHQPLYQRGRSPPPGSARPASKTTSSSGGSRKRFSFSGSRVGVSVGLISAAARNGSNVALRSPGSGGGGGGSSSEAEADFWAAGSGSGERQRSGSVRLRDMDGTGAGRWM